MALFSFFGKRKLQAENSAEAKDAAPVEPQQEPAPAPPNETVESEANGILREQRNIARMTAEKIDAIESEIARDILKSPTQSGAATEADDEENLDPTSEDSPNSLFHTTLIRVDKETMILFREDMDE